MRLNMDCIRDILLCVEENTGLHTSCYFLDIPLMTETQHLMGENPIDIPEYQTALLKKYDNDVLFYHVQYCTKAELISINSNSATYIAVITDLTVVGHEFLNNIRDSKVWKNLNSAKSVLSSISLEVLQSLAHNAVLSYVSGKLPL